MLRNARDGNVACIRHHAALPGAAGVYTCCFDAFMHASFMCFYVLLDARSVQVAVGDVILAINGQSVEGVGLQDVINAITGPAGSTVQLVLFRPLQPFA